MGAVQSVPSQPAAIQKSKDTGRTEVFSTIFLRLLKTTDILDIRALTKGPGACGDYTILLASDIEKEFRKIRLEGTDSGKTAIKDFLFTRSKGLIEESPSDQVACRALAVFYVRALQLVAALTMSIYTPPDLVNRIRNRVYQGEIKRQRKNIPLSLVEKEEQRIKRDKWFNKFLTNTGSPEIFLLGSSRQLKFNRTTKILTYTDTENQYVYKVLVGIREQETYNVSPEYIHNETYWIELYNPATKEPIFRSLVNADKSGYLFVNKPDGQGEESPVIFNKDWTSDLPEHITNAITGVAPTPKAQNTTTRRASRLNSLYNYEGGALALNRQNVLGANVTRKNTGRSAADIAAEAHRQEIAALQLAAKATLPRPFQESYKSMINWTMDIATWTEAAPASYRSVLLFIKPAPPGGSAASYLCVDNWINMPMRSIQPFASLESLYFNKDDGSMTQDNSASLKTLVSAFASIYPAPLTTKNSVAKQPETFDDLRMPSANEAVKHLLCAKRTAQGDVLLDPISAQILESAQIAILASYTRHFENAYGILARLFSLDKTALGEPVVKFSNAFVTNPGSARVVLEEIIREARSIIASHYIEVETIYADAMKELVKPRR